MKSDKVDTHKVQNAWQLPVHGREIDGNKLYTNTDLIFHTNSQ